ncbi:hypothetical protein BGW80DRAFT_1379077, partial [Lactifluus volemus]
MHQDPACNLGRGTWLSSWEELEISGVGKERRSRETEKTLVSTSPYCCEEI